MKSSGTISDTMQNIFTVEILGGNLRKLFIVLYVHGDS